MSTLLEFLRAWFDRFAVVWADVIPRRKRQAARGVAAGAVPYKRAGRSKKKALAFYAGVDKTLGKFADMKTRKARRALARMPPVDIGLSSTFRSQIGEYLGNLPRCPSWDHFDLVGATDRINLCVMGRLTEDDDDDEPDPFNADRLVPYTAACGWWVGHYHSASMRTLRGRSLRPMGRINLTAKQMRRGYIPAAHDPLIGSKVLAMDYVFSDDHHAGEHAFGRLGISGGGTEWKMLEPDGRLVGSVKEAQLAALVYALDWGNRFLWTVTINRGPIVARLQCDARNVLELLWMRDRATGGRRRKAMIHLVRPHDRRLPSGKTTTVRPHLRGALECNWGAWRITIKPSENDYEVLSRRMLPGQSMIEFIEANVDKLGAVEEEAAAC